jgi:hypothetical protein
LNHHALQICSDTSEQTNSKAAAQRTAFQILTDHPDAGACLALSPLPPPELITPSTMRKSSNCAAVRAREGLRDGILQNLSMHESASAPRPSSAGALRKRTAPRASKQATTSPLSSPALQTSFQCVGGTTDDRAALRPNTPPRQVPLLRSALHTSPCSVKSMHVPFKDGSLQPEAYCALPQQHLAPHRSPKLRYIRPTTPTESALALAEQFPTLVQRCVLSVRLLCHIQPASLCFFNILIVLTFRKGLPISGYLVIVVVITYQGC